MLNMDTVFIHANDLPQYTEGQRRAEAEAFARPIFKLILETAQKGGRKITYDSPHSNNAFEELMAQHGYKVKYNFSQRDGNWYEITWGA